MLKEGPRNGVAGRALAPPIIFPFQIFNLFHFFETTKKISVITKLPLTDICFT